MLMPIRFKRYVMRACGDHSIRRERILFWLIHCEIGTENLARGIHCPQSFCCVCISIPIKLILKKRVVIMSFPY